MLPCNNVSLAGYKLNISPANERCNVLKSYTVMFYQEGHLVLICMWWYNDLSCDTNCMIALVMTPLRSVAKDDSCIANAFWGHPQDLIQLSIFLTDLFWTDGKLYCHLHSLHPRDPPQFLDHRGVLLFPVCVLSLCAGNLAMQHNENWSQWPELVQ